MSGPDLRLQFEDQLSDLINFRPFPIAQDLMLWKFWLGGVFSSVLCLFGFVGNLFAAVVLWGPKMSSAFNQVFSYPFTQL